MSASTIVVAVNAQLLRRVDLTQHFARPQHRNERMLRLPTGSDVLASSDDRGTSRRLSV
jgi:hypothetical protein